MSVCVSVWGTPASFQGPGFGQPETFLDRLATAGGFMRRIFHKRSQTAHDFAFQTRAVIRVLEKANPRSRHGIQIAASRDDLQRLQRQGHLSRQEQAILAVLLAHFSHLALASGQSCLGKALLSEHTILQAAHAGGRREVFHHDGVLALQSAPTSNGVETHRFFRVMQQVAGEKWETPVTADKLLAFSRDPMSSREDAHVALLLYHHFEDVAHRDTVHGNHFIDMSDIQNVARRSDPESLRTITLQGVTGRTLSIPEIQQIEAWLEAHALDENGLSAGGGSSRQETLLGYFDRYDRILCTHPTRPWQKVSRP